MGSMTFSRSLLSRRRQVEILSIAAFLILGVDAALANRRERVSRVGLRCSRRRGDEKSLERAHENACTLQNYVFDNARRIKSPSQSGCATPWRYARSDSTEEFTRRLLYEPSAFCQRSCQ